MRIAQLINSLQYGGAEKVVSSLAVGQSRRGHKVLLICLRDLGVQPVDLAPLAEAGVEVLALGKPEGLHFGTLQKLSRILRDQQFDVVHTHNHLVHHYGALAGRWARTRVIVNTLHGTSSLQASQSWSRVLYLLSCVVGDRVVAVCPQVQEVLRKSFYLARGKVCVVDNGIDLGRFLAVDFRAADDTLIFGTIGRLDPIKDHANLIRAFATLATKYPEVRLRVLGDGDSRGDLEDLVRSLAMEDKVHFDGFSLDTARFLSGVDVYVISSRSEGLPLTLLEAMGAALPVVATAVGGIPDVIRETKCNWLCAPEDPADLAKAMEQALMSQNLTDIGRCNRRIAEKRYSVDRMTLDYERLYEATLAETTDKRLGTGL